MNYIQKNIHKLTLETTSRNTFNFYLKLHVLIQKILHRMTQCVTGAQNAHQGLKKCLFWKQNFAL